MVRALDEESALRHSRLLGVPVAVSLPDDGQIPLEPLKRNREIITASLELKSDSGSPAGILSINCPVPSPSKEPDPLAYILSL